VDFYKLSKLILGKAIKASVLVLTAILLQTTLVYAEPTPSSSAGFKLLESKVSTSMAKQNKAITSCSTSYKNNCRPGEVVFSEATWLFLAALLGFVFLTNKSRV
jgi:hypothetical protein